MANGKLGDHPLTDIVFHGASTFTPEIDTLVKEVHDLGGFDNQLASSYLMAVQSRLGDVDARVRENLLSWLKAALEGERDARRGHEHVGKGGKSP